MFSVTIFHAYILTVVILYIIIVIVIYRVRRVIGDPGSMVTIFLSTYRTPLHGAGAVKNQRRRCGPGFRLGSLFQDDLQLDFILIIGFSDSSLGNFLYAFGQGLSRRALYPFFIAIIIAVFDVVTCTCSGSIPPCQPALPSGAGRRSGSAPTTGL